jgi:hypothetical protein
VVQPGQVHIVGQEAKPAQPKKVELKPQQIELHADGIRLEGLEEALLQSLQGAKAQPRQGIRARVVMDNQEPKSITLSRTTYTLPGGKAETLAAFLRDHVKAPVLETKLEGDHLTVTTTPETQKAIGSLIGLIQGKATSAAPAKGKTVGTELKNLGSSKFEVEMQPLLIFSSEPAKPKPETKKPAEAKPLQFELHFTQPKEEPKK